MLLMFLFCSSKNDVAGPGGSSETQNGFTCTVYLPDGTAAAGVLVRVRPSNYTVFTSDQIKSSELTVIDTFTDGEGRLTIKSIENGRYFVEINDQKSNAALILLNADSTLQTDTVTLHPYAQIRGKLDTGYARLKHVQITGLERTVEIQNGTYAFNDLPEGTYTLSFISEEPGIPLLTVDSVYVQSNQVTVVGYKYTEEIIINTTSNGANISEDVYNFPLLLRIDMKKLQINPEDSVQFCFTKGDGTTLPHQVELIDFKNEASVIWIKVDTVKGNDSDHIYMHYRKGITEQDVSESEVFDSRMYAGVWHLSELSNNEINGYKDATVHGRNGTGQNMLTGEAVQGIIGRCQNFNGVDQYIKISGLLDRSGSLTISAWVNSNDTSGEIVTIGDDAGFRIFSDSIGSGIYSYYSLVDNYSWQKVNTYASIAGSLWHHIAFVIDSSAGFVSIFIDAVLHNRYSMAGEIVYNKSSDDTFLGLGIREPNLFQGYMDEVRIYNKAIDENRLKLCLENQKKEQKLITIRY